jgi:hypothetical protein
MTGTTLDAIEPTAASYARVSIPISGNWSTPSSGITQYNGTVNLSPSENWGLVTHWALCTTQTAGEMVVFGTLTSAINILAAGSALTQIPPGYIRLIVG